METRVSLRKLILLLPAKTFTKHAVATNKTWASLCALPRKDQATEWRRIGEKANLMLISANVYQGHFFPSQYVVPNKDG